MITYLKFLIFIFFIGCNTFDKSGYITMKNNSKVIFKKAEITDMHKSIFIEQKEFYLKINKRQIKELYIEKKLNDNIH